VNNAVARSASFAIIIDFPHVLMRLKGMI